MKTIELTINGALRRAQVEPRLQLADLLREHLGLTGTHLGCEHGVCGACTVELNGAPARSCIAYAVACDGAAVRTIEGFDDDAVMADLREAFRAEHALQCGYCTPGMLVTARDIVQRLPGADEARIRKELAGNLCRCTGYLGIVRAIQRVLAKRAITESSVESGRASGAGEGHEAPRETATPPPARSEPPTPIVVKDEPSQTLRESFVVSHPREVVWAFFSRLDAVIPCLPGASVIGTPAHDHADIRLRVKLGPITPEFEGSVDVSRYAASFSGLIRGRARDTRSSSATRGEVRYALIEDDTATRVEVDVSYTLTGPLAQFSRSSLVRDIASRMTAAFAQNLEARLSAPEDRAHAVREIDAGLLVLSTLWARIRSRVRALLRR